MTRKSVTITEEQDQYLKDNHIEFSGWARSQVKERRDEEGPDGFPVSREHRDGDMVHKQVRMEDDLAEFIDENHVNLSHFIQDRIEDKMERDRRLLELEAMMAESEVW